MSVTINASSTSGLVISNDMSGQLQFQNNGVNLPMSGVAPAFHAYLSGGNQSVSNNTWTKVNLNTEGFDTNSNFDSTTNYRFTPTVAGYYQFNAGILVSLSSGNATTIVVALSKNGSRIAQNESVATVPNGQSVTLSYLVYMNGTTDYMELHGYVSSSAASFTSGGDITFLNGFLARGV